MLGLVKMGKATQLEVEDRMRQLAKANGSVKKTQAA